jgi:DNA-binding MarR family transcriptional regulator
MDSNKVEPKSHVVLRQFRQVFAAVRRHFQSIEKIAGLGGAQIWALSVVALQPGCSVSRIMQLMDIHQSTASNLVRSLVKQGLIVSEKSNEDKRIVELYPLPAGLKLLNQVPQPHAGILPYALEQLDQASLEKIEQALSLVLTKLHVDESTAQTPIAMI